MTKLQLKKLAADTAYDTAQNNLASLDAALSAKVSDLKLTDQEYQALRADAIGFRAQFVTAYNADVALAKRATPAAPAAAQK